MNKTANFVDQANCSTQRADIAVPEQVDDCALSLDAAIEKLESGEAVTSMKVDLGDDIIVQISFDDGLLQRLVGHRRFAGVAGGAADISPGPHSANDEPVWVAPEITDIISTLGSG